MKFLKIYILKVNIIVIPSILLICILGLFYIYCNENPISWLSISNKIVYAASWSYGPDQGEGGIFLINSDGTENKRLTYSSGGDPNWSKDCKIIYVSGGRIKQIDINGKNEIIILNLPTKVSHPVYSPDGTKIAFLQWYSGAVFDVTPTKVSIINSNGTNLRDVNDFYEGCPASMRTVSWLNNNKLIFDMKGDLFSIYIDGSDKVNLTNTTDIYEFGPAVSNNGHMIAYLEQYGNSSEIVISDINFKNKIKSDFGYPYFAFELSWSQNDSYLVFILWDGISHNIYKIKNDLASWKPIIENNSIDYRAPACGKF